MISIYRLINPINNDTFYVGASYNPVLRLKQHIQLTGTTKNAIRKNKIISEILSEGLIPLMDILEIAEDDNVQEREDYYISHYNLNDVCYKSNYSERLARRCYMTSLVKMKKLSFKLEESVINALEYESMLSGYDFEKWIKMILVRHINDIEMPAIFSDDKIHNLKKIAKKETGVRKNRYTDFEFESN